MTSSSQLAQYFWVAQPILQFVLAATMWRRKLYKQFPTFFAYILVQIVNFGITFPLQNNYKLYFWLYWIGAGINALLTLKVIHEIFLDVFRPYHTLKDLGTILFKWTGALMLVVSVLVAFSRSTARYDPLWKTVSTLQSSMRLMQFGLILFLLLFSRFLGVSRRQQSFGIALGFGAFVSVELMLLAILSGGFVRLETCNLLNIIAYDGAVMVWVGYAFARISEREAAANHFQTDRWEYSLAGIQHPGTSESLIPKFESMVERAFSRGDVGNGAEHSAHSGASIPARAAAAAGGQTRK